MSMLLLAPALQAQEDSEILRRYFEDSQIREFREIQADVDELVSLFVEVRSVEEFDNLLSVSFPAMQIMYLNLQQLLLEIVRPDQNDYTNLIKFTRELNEQVIDPAKLEYIESQMRQMDYAHAQRLELSLQHYLDLDNWLLDELPHNIRRDDFDNPTWQELERNMLLLRFLFLSIGSILRQPSYKASLPLLIDAFYMAIAHINFAMDEQGSQSELITRPPQDLEALGYGKGRFEGETDEEVERFIEIMQEIRQRD